MKNVVYDELLEKARDISQRKNSNYATDEDPLSNLKECTRFGVSPALGVMVRLGDKWSRLCEMMKGKPDMVNESIEDTLLDMANYCLLMICVLREEKDKKKK